MSESCGFSDPKLSKLVSFDKDVFQEAMYLYAKYSIITPEQNKTKTNKQKQGESLHHRI